MLRSSCHAVGSPATLPTMNPTSGQRITIVNTITSGVAEVVEQPGQEVGERLVALVSPAAGRPPGEQRADADADEAR